MRKYAICDIDLLDEVDSEGNLIFNFNEVLETRRETMRISNDGLFFVTKWEGNTPIFLNDVDTYTHAEILEELDSANWIINED